MKVSYFQQKKQNKKVKKQTRPWSNKNKWNEG